MRHLNKKWNPGGIQMVHTVVLYCQTLDKHLKIMKINCLHPEAQLLGYKCNLRYIFKYTL